MIAIFDWDGTLMDSTGKIITCMQQAASRVGLEVLGDRAIANIIGLGLPEAVRTLYPYIDAAQAEQLRSSYSQIFIHEDTSPCNLFAGVEEGLQRLEAANIALAVATGKSRKGLNRMLAMLGWQERFAATRCADETASKPNPLMLQQILAELAAAPAGAVMVGDTEYDLAMAAALNMPSLGLAYGAHEAERLHAHKPALVTDQFTLVVDWILARAAAT
ncbi:MAG TPA: HAD-IA family hydrolase [Marinagarivorans sp.]|nr:HAD-IA family hydrolase [Cellvibrionaceae bacterium]HMY39592.1 HAD-IA family hydrolase [Marinagarivorans sp.]HNG59573.1 HAD-IA family hydrolase [Cellvibrionaceae bacterium]